MGMVGVVVGDRGQRVLVRVVVGSADHTVSNLYQERTTLSFPTQAIKAAREILL